MKKKAAVIMLSICVMLLCSCSKFTSVEESGKWDCSVSCAEESSADTYVITYSDEKIASKNGILSFQNLNNFNILES